MRSRRTLLATVLSLTPSSRAMHRLLSPSSRRWRAFGRITADTGDEPRPAIVARTDIAAAVRILCVRVHLLRSIRTALRTSGGRLFYEGRDELHGFLRPTRLPDGTGPSGKATTAIK